MASQPARLWLIRHGQTDWNAIGRVQGQTPTELNAQGRREALEVGEILARSRRKFAACYASDLPRAAETARIIAQQVGLEVVEVPGLRERSFGKLEGATSAEVRAARTAAGLADSTDLADWTGLSGVESNDALYARSTTALREISERHPAADVVVVTHGGVMGRLLFRTLGIADGAPRRFPLSNGMCAIVQAFPENFYLLTLADLGLLTGEPPAPDTAMSPPPARTTL
jgi:probable phosphoglycerate mutase